MTIQRMLVASAPALLLLTLPCQAGPCTKDIEAMQARVDAHLGKTAAAGPSAQQSVGAQMHRQPTPNTMANAERKLGELSPETIAKVNAAMERAHKADLDGDEKGCRAALAEAAKEIGP